MRKITVRRLQEDVLSDLPELQQTIRTLPGVRHARVRWSRPDAPALLEVAFEDEADEDAVTAEVLAAAERILGVDRTELEVRKGRGAEAAGDHGDAGDGGDDGGHDGDGSSSGNGHGALDRIPSRTRPIFSGLRVDRQQLDMSVDVTLIYDGRTVVGSAEGLATHQHHGLTAAAAVLAALRSFLPVDLRVQVEWVDVMDGSTPSRPTVVQVMVTCLGPMGEQQLIGSAMSRGDIREAAARATLDALNRPLERLTATV